MYSKMKDFKAEFRKIGIVPVVVLDDAKDAAPLAKALVEGGLPCAEVTFRTAAAADVIKNMVDEFPEILAGRQGNLHGRHSKRRQIDLSV